jgi:hypothetical protein
MATTDREIDDVLVTNDGLRAAGDRRRRFPRHQHVIVRSTVSRRRSEMAAFAWRDTTKEISTPRPDPQ